MSLLTTWLASPPPDAAIEIAADRVAAAVLTTRASGIAVSAHAAEPLPPDVITPSLAATNVHDRSAAVGALRRVLDRLPVKVRRAALVIPDTAVKVSLLRFDHVPPRRDDLDQLVRWQLRKAAPFALDDACVTHSPGAARPGTAREFIVELARRDTIREYETICEEAGIYAGLVDAATLAVMGLFGGSAAPAGDWLLVHVRPDYISIVIARGADMIFYRSRPEDEGTDLQDLVHQTAMYYQDRLEGQGFTRVMLTGGGGAPGSLEMARRNLEARLGIAVEPVDPTRVATLRDRIQVSPDLMDVLSPLVGIHRRVYSEVPA